MLSVRLIPLVFGVVNARWNRSDQRNKEHATRHMGYRERSESVSTMSLYMVGRVKGNKCRSKKNKHSTPNRLLYTTPGCECDDPYLIPRKRNSNLRAPHRSTHEHQLVLKAPKIKTGNPISISNHTTTTHSGGNIRRATIRRHSQSIHLLSLIQSLVRPSSFNLAAAMRCQNGV